MTGIGFLQWNFVLGKTMSEFGDNCLFYELGILGGMETRKVGAMGKGCR